jgi:hypothetical protein
VSAINESSVGVMASVEVIMNEKGKAAEEVPFESVTIAVPEIVAGAKGVPEIVTVLPEEAKVRVVGNPVMFHVKGATPPVTVSMPE